MQSERNQLELFRAIPRDMAVRDTQDLMAYPFFSLAKSRRTKPIDYAVGEVVIRVEAVAEHGMATIWDADILIWAASHLIEATDQGLPTSRLVQTSPHEILTFLRRGTGGASYLRLKQAFDRLQSTTVATSLHRGSSRRLHRFSWLNEWMERGNGHDPAKIELVLPDWFYRLVVERRLILTIDPFYFELTGGLERWLYRIVRKHGGHQTEGWSFDLRHLHLKSGSMWPYRRFAHSVRAIVRGKGLPGYWLALERSRRGATLLTFRPACAEAVNSLVLSGTRGLVRSGNPDSYYQEQNSRLSPAKSAGSVTLNLDSNESSNVIGPAGGRRC